jgi:isopentenyl diphosphate isomerase/L-lactate dehydrogenase-like FMN-dependent dehydrogenase
MSNDTVEEVGGVERLHHWWQLYVFGGDEVWQELLRRADGCEALVLTTNAQIFGDREWSRRTRATKTRPSIPTVLDAMTGRSRRSTSCPAVRDIVGDRIALCCSGGVRRGTDLLSALALGARSVDELRAHGTQFLV